MSESNPGILKNKVLLPADDFYHLRREGIGFIEEMGSQYWTDYNMHDPGITILEALCYGITDLAYRCGWKIEDLLMAATPSNNPTQPFPFQAFFTARDILTVNPVTPEDFRRLLIDLDNIRNAWIICKECSCDLHFYSWCEDNELKFSYERPLHLTTEPSQISVQGLYEVLVELEKDDQSGDLNDQKLERTYVLFDDDGRAHTGIVELRFPEWGLEKKNEFDLLLQMDDAFANTNGQSVQITFQPTPLPVNKDLALLSEIEFKRHWRNAFSLSFELEFLPGGEIIPIQNIALRIFGDEVVKKGTTLAMIKAMLTEVTPDSFIQLHRLKQKKIRHAIEIAGKALHSHRNLDEDYCLIRPIQIDDVAVCADIEVAPGADIELIQATIWFEIEKYFNPPVPFYTLDEMLNDGIPVEDIFNGPALDNGFLKTENLQEADLKKVLRVSDLINLLMDIPGIVAIHNLLLTKYDHHGNTVRGDADPTFINNVPQFDPNKISARWLLYVTDQHQPRLYRNLSSFLFFKNGLPFLPRKDEAYDTYVQLTGMAEKPKLPGARNDLEIPSGQYRNPGGYTPVQYSFPLVYGIGPEGLPLHVNNQRRAEANQLKAYLQVFEQILGSGGKQLEHLGDLFSLDQNIIHTYFSHAFDETNLNGISKILGPKYHTEIEGITEQEADAARRRNHFLNHLLSRFGESFEEYALLITRWHGEKIGNMELIKDKISFLNSFPRISHDRYKAFDYTQDTHKPENSPGLKDRINVLLGNPILHFEWNTFSSSPGVYEITSYTLFDTQDSLWLKGIVSFTSDSVRKVEALAYRTILRQMVLQSAYAIVAVGTKFQLNLTAENGDPLGSHLKLFDDKESALRLRDELVAWASHSRAIIVEHLLLRPKFAGDALYPGCIEGECHTCGDEDPYSFRLTIVMPGWTEPYSYNLDMRGFADRTIREQVPSHLVPKICWVGNNGFIPNPCDPIINDLATLLINESQTADGTHPTEEDACSCSTSIYEAFAETFRHWYEDKSLIYFDETALRNELETLFNSLDLADITCVSDLTALRTLLYNVLIPYFADIVIHGWQFEKFETAWYEWLEINEGFTWTEQRLHDRVEAILLANLVSGDKAQACACADKILSHYGATFYEWMAINFKSGKAFEDFTAFVPDPISVCTGLNFTPGINDMLEVLLEDRYEDYKKVSYHLWKVVHLLSQLRNTYPGATLHDCDDGSDDNPVRLGSTTLGNYPMKRTASSGGFVPLNTPSGTVTRMATAGRASKTATKGKPDKPVVKKATDKKAAVKKVAAKKAVARKTIGKDVKATPALAKITKTEKDKGKKNLKNKPTAAKSKITDSKVKPVAPKKKTATTKAKAVPKKQSRSKPK